MDNYTVILKRHATYQPRESILSKVFVPFLLRHEWQGTTLAGNATENSFAVAITQIKVTP
jgi:hypothetical protein